MTETLSARTPDGEPRGAWIIWLWDGGVEPIALYGADQELEARRRLDECTDYELQWWPLGTDWVAI